MLGILFDLLLSEYFKAKLETTKFPAQWKSLIYNVSIKWGILWLFKWIFVESSDKRKYQCYQAIWGK